MQTVTKLVSKQKYETEISHQQRTVVQKYKRTCITVLKVLSHDAIKILHIPKLTVECLTLLRPAFFDVGQWRSQCR